MRARSWRGREKSRNARAAEHGHDDGDLMSVLADDAAADDHAPDHAPSDRAGASPATLDDQQGDRVGAKTATESSEQSATGGDREASSAKATRFRYDETKLPTAHGWNVLLQVSPGSSTSGSSGDSSRPTAAKSATQDTQRPQVVSQPGPSQVASTEPTGAKAPNAAPEVATASAGPAGDGSDTGKVRARRRAAVIGWAAAVVLIVVAVIAQVIYVSGRSGDSAVPRSTEVPTDSQPQPRRSTAVPSQPAAANLRAGAVAWIGKNLSSDDRIGADTAVIAVLTRMGFQDATNVTGSAGQTSSALGRLDWLVSDSVTRKEPSLASLFQSSVPIARFGSGPNAVEIRSVLLRSPSKIRSLLARDTSNRALAGVGLAANPNLMMSAPIRRELQAGRVDLRPATFLAVLGSMTMAKLVETPQDPAERAAARPVRRLSIEVRPASVRATLRALPPEYQPAHITTRKGITTLSWDPAVSTVQPIS